MLVELNHHAHHVLRNPANKRSHASEVGDLGYGDVCSFDSGRSIYAVYFPRIDRREYWFEDCLIVYDAEE